VLWHRLRGLRPTRLEKIEPVVTKALMWSAFERRLLPSCCWLLSKELKKRGGQTLQMPLFFSEGKAFPPPHGAHHQPCLACKTRHPTLRQRLCLISTSFLLTRRLSLFSVPEREACAVGNQASVGVWAPFEPLAATNQLAAAAPQGGQGLACLKETWSATLGVIYEHFLPAQKWSGNY
jgi:hypothetical protein